MEYKKIVNAVERGKWSNSYTNHNDHNYKQVTKKDETEDEIAFEEYLNQEIERFQKKKGGIIRK